MDKASARALNRRLLQNVMDNKTDPASAEHRLPADVFCCPVRFDQECEILFRQTPQPVAFSAELPEPGSFLALNVVDVPVLLTRLPSGEIRAFINSCAHRGAELVAGAGASRRLVCPFHGWSYGLDGSCMGRPGEDAFSTPLEKCALMPLPVRELAGIVFVGLTSGAPLSGLEASMGELMGELAHCRLENCVVLERREYRVDANWKLVTDLSLESYHFNSLHRDSVAAVLLPNAVVDTFGQHSRWAFPLKEIKGLSELEETDWPERLQGSCTYTLFPGVMVIVNASGAQMIRAEPGASVGFSRVTYVGLRYPEMDVDEAYSAYEFGGEVFEKEDLPIAESCQRGLAAGRRDLTLGTNEPLLQFWHTLWNDALNKEQ